MRQWKQEQKIHIEQGWKGLQQGIWSNLPAWQGHPGAHFIGLCPDSSWICPVRETPQVASRQPVLAWSLAQQSSSSYWGGTSCVSVSAHCLLSYCHHWVDPGFILLASSLHILIDIDEIQSQSPLIESTGPVSSAFPHKRGSSL